MKKRLFPILIMILTMNIAASLLLAGCSDIPEAEVALEESVEEPEPTPTPEPTAEPTPEPTEEPEPEEEPLPEVYADDWAEAFSLGNESYEAEDWRMAEAYYILAADLCEDGDDDYRKASDNNRGLALLQQGKNREALEVYKALIEEDYWGYGYWVNYLVAGCGCGMSAEELLEDSDAMDVMRMLAIDAGEKPGKYQRLLYSIYYNMVYIDMEDDELSNLHVRYYDVDDWDIGYAYEDLDDLSREECIDFFISLLSAINEQSVGVYGESDPDLEELITYLEAKYINDNSDLFEDIPE